MKKLNGESQNSLATSCLNQSFFLQEFWWNRKPGTTVTRRVRTWRCEARAGTAVVRRPRITRPWRRTRPTLRTRLTPRWRRSRPRRTSPSSRDPPVLVHSDRWALSVHKDKSNRATIFYQKNFSKLLKAVWWIRGCSKFQEIREQALVALWKEKTQLLLCLDVVRKKNKTVLYYNK